MNLTSETSKNENGLEIVSGENLNLNKNLSGVGMNIQKVRTHKGGSSQMRTIAYKRRWGGIILAILYVPTMWMTPHKS